MQMTYLEVQDDGPDEAKGQLGIPVDNVFSPDVDKLNLQQTANNEGVKQKIRSLGSHTLSSVVSYIEKSHKLHNANFKYN